MWFGTIRQLVSICNKGEIKKIIKDLTKDQALANYFEQKSWENSIPVLAKALDLPNLHELHIFIELKIPCSNSRCDAVIIGFGKNQSRRVVIIELKQWEKCFGTNPEMISFTSTDTSYERLHPCSQVEGYKNYLKNYDAALVNKKIESEIFGCAFLHNMKDISPLGQGLSKKAKKINSNLLKNFPVFGKNDGSAFAKWVQEKFANPANNDFFNEFLERKKQPSTNLVFDLKEIANSNNHPWIPLDFQREVYNQILNVLNEFKSTDNPKRKVIVVTGPPGSGKSILALAVLLKAASDEYNITKSVLLTNHTYQKKTLDGALNLRKKKYLPPSRKLSANPVIDSIDFIRDFAKNRKTKKDLREEYKTQNRKTLTQKEYDEYKLKWREDYLKIINNIDPVHLTICDESQALFDPFKPMVSRIGTGRHWSPSYGPQAWHIMMGSIISIFFLDEDQGYRQQERETAMGILNLAKNEEIEILELSLGSGQFRLNGGDLFVSWLDWELHVKKHKPAPPAWAQKEVLQDLFMICEDANEMRNEIKKLYRNDKKCRLFAGYAWKWISKDNPNEIDSRTRSSISKMCFKWVLADKQREYNLGVKPYNTPNALFGIGNTQPATVAYPLTVRGCDFSHIGVFWGLDLVWRKDRWIVQLDYVFGTDNKTWCEDAKKEIQNRQEDGGAFNRLIYVRACAYRILLTRAMKSVRLWIEDKETREHLKQSWNDFLSS